MFLRKNLGIIVFLFFSIGVIWFVTKHYKTKIKTYLKAVHLKFNQLCIFYMDIPLWKQVFFLASILILLLSGQLYRTYQRYHQDQELIKGLRALLNNPPKEDTGVSHPRTPVIQKLDDCLTRLTTCLARRQKMLEDCETCLATREKLMETLQNQANVIANTLQQQKNHIVQFQEVEQGWLAERDELRSALSDCRRTMGNESEVSGK
jgi:hypothetical protein